jgi:hypothetical protein
MASLMFLSIRLATARLPWAGADSVCKEDDTLVEEILKVVECVNCVSVISGDHFNVLGYYVILISNHLHTLRKNSFRVTLETSNIREAETV